MQCSVLCGARRSVVTQCVYVITWLAALLVAAAAACSVCWFGYCSQMLWTEHSASPPTCPVSHALRCRSLGRCVAYDRHTGRLALAGRQCSAGGSGVIDGPATVRFPTSCSVASPEDCPQYVPRNTTMWTI